MTANDLRGGSAVVGVGLAGCGEAPGRTAMELIGEASWKAVTDAGLRMTDIDAVFGVSAVHGMPSVTISEYLGIRPVFSDGSMIGGSSNVAHLLMATMAIRAGLCRTALVCYGSNQKSASGRLVSSAAEFNPYEQPYKPRFPMNAYALAASRHMHQYGTTRRHLAEVAVAARAWANLNPEAYMHGPMTIDDVLNARMVCDPFGLLDCCLVTDGGGALVVVARERARDFPRKPVYFLGGAMAHWHRSIMQMPDLTVTAASESGPRAFAMAGMTPRDIDVLELYDAFTINTILFLEDLGFCPKGEGGRFVEGGRIAPGGSLPVNTNGGGLSCVHPGMYGTFILVEAVRQLRGEAGDRQAKKAETAIVHGNGGVLSSQVTAILGTEATL
ncbi:MAG: thiolase [Alphaproteobacteria bacterium]|nr:thiolase [Alphaproteobacteria bacterium]